MELSDWFPSRGGLLFLESTMDDRITIEIDRETAIYHRTPGLNPRDEDHDLARACAAALDEDAVYTIDISDEDGDLIATFELSRELMDAGANRRPGESTAPQDEICGAFISACRRVTDSSSEG